MNITYDEWFDTYKPITDEQGQALQFETYGSQLDIVENTPHNKVWTWVDGGDYSGICAGFAYVNRLVYYISKVPWESEDLYVDLYEPDECEKSGHSYQKVERYDGKEYDVCEHCGEDKEYLEQYDD